jgi:hypothetical protein
MSLLAKPVVKNTCWIVEEDGKKIGSILANEQGVTLVSGSKREKFPNFKLLSDRYNIIIDKTKTQYPLTESSLVYGFPCDRKAYNVLWDVKHRLPIYTKTSKSKSFFCAGYYLIQINDTWIKSCCPKLITLNRHNFFGPYRTLEEMQDHTNHLTGVINGITT